MRTAAAALLAIAALIAGALPALAQDEETAPPLTVITNAEFCSLVSPGSLTCEEVITSMAAARILPEAFSGLIVTEPTDETTVDELGGSGGVGDTLARDDLEITLLRAGWNLDSSDAFYKPGKGRKYVSVLVRYEVVADGATYNIIFWDATDKAGKRYEATVLGPITPDLKVGDLKAGEAVQGWVTYEVPRDVNQLTLIESQVLEDDLAWTAKR